jgi:C_GCAxxG_C_C family probable redox protein
MSADMAQADLAVQRFVSGYSCSQAVFSVLAEPRGIETDTALRIAAGLGGGIARSAETCGCVTGAVMAIGLEQRDVCPEQNWAAREKTYDLARRMLRDFTERNGSTECRVLMGCDIGTPEGMEEARRKGIFRSRCPKLVRDAVEIVNLLVP